MMTCVEKLRADLAWRSPSLDKPMAHVVLERTQAEDLLRLVEGLTSQQVEAARNSKTVEILRDYLDDIYEPEEFGMWLALPHPQFGISVLQMIHAGRDGEVLHVAAQLRDGVYV